ncbi:hypothetical protein PIB30_026530 [Stylosanthes scabra]|uniref:Uncharacterized protein n=1 Tax=Stylosanthes scabra TaxID=79078 RepID=A0ABU6QAV8_9FABA|nr:hypothetical protein [Stylosanthes scabra]
MRSSQTQATVGSANGATLMLPSQLSGSANAKECLLALLAANASRSLPSNDTIGVRQSNMASELASEENKHGTFATILIEFVFYTRLVEFEARVDDTLAKRRIKIQEAIRSNPSVRKMLRVYVLNTFAKNQTLTNFLTNKQPEEAASSWSLKILGSILEDNDDPSPIFDPKFIDSSRESSIFRTRASSHAFGNSSEIITFYDIKVDVPLTLDENISQFVAATNAASEK